VLITDVLATTQISLELGRSILMMCVIGEPQHIDVGRELTARLDLFVSPCLVNTFGRRLNDLEASLLVALVVPGQGYLVTVLCPFSKLYLRIFVEDLESRDALVVMHDLEIEGHCT